MCNYAITCQPASDHRQIGYRLVGQAKLERCPNFGNKWKALYMYVILLVPEYFVKLNPSGSVGWFFEFFGTSMMQTTLDKRM